MDEHVNRIRLAQLGEDEVKRNGSPTFYKMLREMADIHDKKSHDYASNDKPYGNYHFAGQVSALFSHSPEDAGFAGRLAEKIYRLSVLEKDRKIPLNESIEDTERDIATIVVLWMASRRDRYRGNAVQSNTVQNSVEMIEAGIKQSEEACIKMIELEPYLTERDKKQMIEYLRACLRDSTHMSDVPSQK